MGRVRQKSTSAETAVRHLLHGSGARYRVNDRNLPGRPDIVNRRRKKAIFVHGCFWHHHTRCERGRIPSRNAQFWTEKFRANIERDNRKTAALQDLGFDVLVVWECELKDTDTLRKRLSSFWLLGRGAEQRCR